ncbi:hypothetical protein BGZ61DRAFT_348634, partial [Ilyonectria robusta]|uniref:uncharacterized protein n=1 Tax=Ilyonectria robusta TaxID=1079257 RepID=UPI001E8E96A7
EDYQLPIHQKYRLIVQLAPGYIQVADAKVIETIYRPKQNFLKSNFYLLFNAKISPRPNNFAVVDNKVHSKQRRAVAHIYT